MALLLIAIHWLHGFWEYYRGYTHSAIHALAVAALTIFGLLIFIDPIFAVMAIISYICPPIVLYVLGIDVGTDLKRSNLSRVGSDKYPDSDPDIDSDSDNGDSDSDSDGNDTDSDTDGADTDTDSDTYE